MSLALRPSLAALVALWLAACAAGPDYVRPALDVPAAYKEDASWKSAEPRSVDGRERWWTWYGDPTLDVLVDDANAANQTIAQAEAQYRAALAAVDAARSAYWPAGGVTASANRGASTSTGRADATAVAIGVSASWEPDLFGGVRRKVEAGTATAAASAGDLGAARLAIQSALVQDYLQLRSSTCSASCTRDGRGLRKALQLTRAQFRRRRAALRRRPRRDAAHVDPGDAADLEASAPRWSTRSRSSPAARRRLRAAAAVRRSRPRPGCPRSRARCRASSSSGGPTWPRRSGGGRSERPDRGRPRRLLSGDHLDGERRRRGELLGPFFDTPRRVWGLGAALAQTLFDGGLRRARSAQARRPTTPTSPPTSRPC